MSPGIWASRSARDLLNLPSASRASDWMAEEGGEVGCSKSLVSNSWFRVRLMLIIIRPPSLIDEPSLQSLAGQYAIQTRRVAGYETKPSGRGGAEGFICWTPNDGIWR